MKNLGACRALALYAKKLPNFELFVAPPFRGKRWFAAALAFLGLFWAPLRDTSAMDWPSADAVMLNNFGGNNQGRPLLGAAFQAEGPVQAAEAGDILFIHDPENTASRLPSPLGAWVALDHGDGLISIYSRLESPAELVPDRLSQGRTIGTAGRSGWSNRRGFYFLCFDRKERRWINPSMIITPLPDTRPPVIASVELKNSDGQGINPALTRTIGQGRYTIAVIASDTRLDPQDSPLAPYRILCSVNGLETGALNFETYSARDGVLMVYRNGLVPVRQVYAPYPAFEVGELWFTRGQATLEIIVQDISGNIQNATFRLQVE
jgi:hypothetical protein